MTSLFQWIGDPNEVQAIHVRVSLSWEDSELHIEGVAVDTHGQPLGRATVVQRRALASGSNACLYVDQIISEASQMALPF